MIALALAVALGAYTPDEARSLFDEARVAASNDNYDLATEKLGKLVDSGYANADVLYNLGTIALRRGNLGEAMLYLEWARRVGGGEDVDANLALLRERQIDRLIGDESGTSLRERIAAATDVHSISLLFLAAWWFGIASYLAGRFLRRPSLRLLGGLSVAFALLCFALTVNAALLPRRDAVVMVPTTQVQDAPDKAAKVSFEIHQGLTARVREEANGFSRIRLPNGLEGWVKSTDLADIPRP